MCLQIDQEIKSLSCTYHQTTILTRSVNGFTAHKNHMIIMCVVVEPIWAAPDEQSYSSGGQPPKLEGIPSAYIADIDFTHAVKEVSELAVM